MAEGDHDVGNTGSRELVRDVTSRFVRAYLFNDATARNTLRGGQFQDLKGELHDFRIKLVERWWHLDQRDFVAWVREMLPWGRWLHDFSVVYHRGLNVKE